MKHIFNLPNLEEWRDIVGFEGLYKVSNLGRVLSVARMSSNNTKRVPEKILKPTGTRYLSVSLWRDGQWANKLVHRLVAESFIPNPDDLPEINHKDKDITNNKVENLEWVSASDNHNHGVSTRKGYSYRRKVYCIEMDVTFPSISAAGRSVDADATQIVESIDAKRCCKGYTFVYSDALPNNLEKYAEEAHAKYQAFHYRPNMKNSKKVQIAETGQIFDSIAAAAKFFNCDTATISNRIKAGRAFDGVTLVSVID